MNRSPSLGFPEYRRPQGDLEERKIEEKPAQEKRWPREGATRRRPLPGGGWTVMPVVTRILLSFPADAGDSDS
jgi:hypothetical protein